MVRYSRARRYRKSTGDPTWTDVRWALDPIHATPVPKSPCVYVIQAGARGPVKIGWASDVADRLETLQVANAEVLRIVTVFHGASRRFETLLHHRFAEYRLRGEWFAAAVIPRVLAFQVELNAARTN